mgnify:CR=1 FL=1
MTITLGRLRSFVALAETGSFHKTAEIVGRSQPAVTAQIKTMEETLGVPLFYRRTRNVDLTKEGELLYNRLRRILSDLDLLFADLHKAATLEAGEVRIGATPTLAGYILPEIIKTYRDKYPGVRVQFVDEPTTRLERLVANRELDFYFGPKPSVASGLAFEFVAEDEYVVVVPKSHKLANSRSISARKLSEHSILLMRRNTMVRQEIEQFFAKHDLHIEPAEEASNHFTLGGLVEAGCGITLLPRSALPLVAHPGVSIVSISGPTFFRTLGIATLTDYRPSPAATAFMKMITPLIKKRSKRR